MARFPAAMERCIRMMVQSTLASLVMARRQGLACMLCRMDLTSRESLMIIWPMISKVSTSALQGFNIEEVFITTSSLEMVVRQL